MAKHLFGKKALFDNLDNHIIIKVDLAKPNQEIINILKAANIKYQVHNDADHFFDQFSKGLNHQGIVTTVKQNHSLNLLAMLDTLKTKSSVVILVVDSIQDAHNFGAILRTCDAFKVDIVIYKKDNQVPINDFVAKASMGAINNLTLCPVINLSQTLELLKQNGYWLYASGLNTGAINYATVAFDKHTVLIIGNENKGVATNLLKCADFIVQIPMHGKVQSLNVSVATGILLAKIREQLS
ncbi:MAG: 23S rRNA (guanosine(2251)-2'-O)-methyltransferase RlmB [Mycoplasmataceae bacterium]|nr:23S rRNA (guanosine(2251)-2'-O)-methyltransferase RlmB [Mycoplasmataceae bacterium]